MKGKILVWLLVAAMVLPGFAFAQGAPGVSIDFEDGLYGFLGLDMTTGNADASVLSVVDYNGSKAVKIETQAFGKVPYVAFELEGLLGERIADVRTIKMDVGIDLGDGKFYACSGRLYAYSGADMVKSYDEWSVYLEKKNPKTMVATITGEETEPFFVAGAGNYIVLSKEVDNYATKTGGVPVALYVDNIAFLDADGNAIPADTSAQYVSKATGKDLSNLVALSGAVEFTGFSCTGGAWGQNGFDMPQEIIDALVPGAVVEVEFASETGDMWLVMPGAAVGWMRVGGGGNGADCVNNGKNIAQIPYELIAQFCGEDKSAWGTVMQCESSGAWEVYAVRVGIGVPQIVLSGAVDFTGFSVSGGAWSQNGLDMPQEIIDALVPGSAIEISFASESGNLWIVMPGAAVGWTRVGDGNNGKATLIGDKCYIPYELIAQFCGEDKGTWGTTLQCESDTAWEAYSVRVGASAQMKMLSGLVGFAGFSVSGGAWSQNGAEMPQEIIDALVPGTCLAINYASESGKLWIVVPDAAAGWMRVGDGSNGAAVCDGSVCQIPYELIAQFCGEDKSTWGARLQCESDTAWEVYSLSVGTVVR